MSKIEPRGLRNCNPGNIRHGKTKWQGMREKQTDAAFVQFVSLEYGYRAMAKLLLSYFQKHGLNTVKGIINRWAPASENHTSLYVGYVCKKLAVKEDEVINVAKKETMLALCTAIGSYENGQAVDTKPIEEGVTMALRRKK